MRKHLLLLLLIVAALNSVGQTVKFQYYQSLIFIPVKIQNVQLLFLLNTGANTSVIDNRVAEQLKLPVIKERDSVTGTAGKSVVALVHIDNLTIGNTSIKNLTVSKRNIESFLRINGQKIDGILGTDILKNYALTIDFQSQKIAIQNAKIPAGRKKTVSFDMYEGIPRVEMRLNDTFNTFFHYNSGTSLTPSKEVYVNIAPLQWKQLATMFPRMETNQYFVGQGVGGGVYMKVVKINSIELNQRQKIYRPNIIIQPEEGYFKQKDAIGFFGNNLLEKYGRVSVDFISRQIVLPVSQPQKAVRKTAGK